MRLEKKQKVWLIYQREKKNTGANKNHLLGMSDKFFKSATTSFQERKLCLKSLKKV